MRRLTLACVLLAGAALAAPVPKGKVGFEAPAWEKTDPAKDCKFAYDAKARSVTFTLPAVAPVRVAGLDEKNDKAPRLLRPAGKGDFDAQVRVRVASEAGVVMAVLLVADRAKGAPGFDRGFGAAFRVEDERWTEATVLRRRRGEGDLSGWSDAPHRVVKGGGGKELREAHLKVQRRGETLKAYLSADGKEWSGPYEPLPRRRPFTYPGELRVGVAVMCRTTRAAEVTFDQFKLTPVKAGKKKD